MLFLHLPTSYLVGISVWAGLMAVGLWALLRSRQRRKLTDRPQRLINVGLAIWMLAATLTLLEVYFALFVDFSDGFNTTNISKRWFAIHIDAERQPPFGNRDAEPLRRKPRDGRKRICFLGDSFTVGHGINDIEDRFSNRIAVGLEQQHPGKYSVTNLGEPGWETSLFEARLRELIAARYQLDVLIYVFMLNDIEGFDPKTMDAIRSVQQEQPRFFLWTDTYFFNFLYYRYLQAAKTGSLGYFPHLVESYQGKPWTGLEAKLQSMASICRENQIDFRLVIFPFLHDLEPDFAFKPAHEKLTAFANKHAIPVLDLHTELSPHKDERLIVNAYDLHPNERANELVAKALRDKLLSDLFDEE